MGGKDRKAEHKQSRDHHVTGREVCVFIQSKRILGNLEKVINIA